MTGQKKKYKSSKIKSFLFFLLLAVLFWVLTKFSEETTSPISASLVYTNLPSSVSINPSTATDIRFDISANGFQFLSYNMNKPQIEIDVARYYSDGDTALTISGTELDKIISDYFGKDTRVSKLSINSLFVSLDVLVSKKVPVQLISEINYKEGYKLVGPLKIQPDSVLVSGPSSAIEAFSEVATELFVARDVSENIKKSLQLQYDKTLGVSLSETSVVVALNVEEFAQKRLMLPVAVINVPPDIKLKLIPESIEISFDVSVHQFNQISENDFRLVCDYASRSTSEAVLVPQLTEQPEGIYHIDWNTKKVEYLIFK